MKKTKIFNGNILNPFINLGLGTIIIEDGKITGVEKGNVEVLGAEEIDVKGAYIAPGFIDLHTHGAGGSDFMDNTVEACLQIAHTHALHGTTLLYPTTLSAGDEELFQFFDIYKEAKKVNNNGAAFGGIHLEGPYFAYNYKGAQDPRFLSNPRPEHYNQILERSDDIHRWSIAPELPGAIELGKTLVERGIIASIAHTEAIYEEVEVAHKAGYNLMTHFYSAMSGITRKNAFRYAGCLEAGYLMDEMDVEIICDGVHVPKPLLQLITKIKGADRVALITDSMRGAGMPDGKSILGSYKAGQEVLIEDGVAKLMDRSAFAGSVATADRLIRTMHQVAERPLTEAVTMMTATPARIAKVNDRKGKIEVGYDADLVVFDKDINIQMTMINGKAIKRD